MWMIIGGILLILFAGVMLSSKGRTLVKGFFGLFIEDMAKTPEGADAIYSQAIEEAQEQYNKANNNLRRFAGMLETSKTNKFQAENQIRDCERKCEILVSKGQEEDAMLYAQRREEHLEDLAQAQKEIEEYTKAVEEAKIINNTLEAKLIKLKKDRKTVVRKLEMNKQTESLYDDLDQLKHSTGTSKLLETVKDEVVNSTERAKGARIVHESKTSTKIDKLENSLKNTSGSDYIAELKAKQALKNR